MMNNFNIVENSINLRFYRPVSFIGFNSFLLFRNGRYELPLDEKIIDNQFII